MFEVKTGDIVQYWVTGAEGELAAKLLNTLDCSGRSQLKEPAFGNDFLFLTREVDRARVRARDTVCEVREMSIVILGVPCVRTIGNPQEAA
jgi:hypothetical protein